jgi:diguanylate cyclase (GGDEF)-like protein
MFHESHEGTETIESLREQKRRIYLWSILAGLLALLVGWIPKALSGTISPYERIIFPIATVLCLGLLIALWKTLRVLTFVELSLFAITGFSLLSKLLEILQTPQPNRLAAFSDLLYWFPLVYILAFLIFDSRRQLLIGSVIFFTVSVLIGMIYTIPPLLNGQATDLYLLGRFYLANAAYIILLMMGVRSNEQYVHMHTLAATMTRLANTDALIQISNRRELEETIAREIKQTTQDYQPLSAVLFDLDHFKRVNDTYGHLAGDNVLKETARLVQTLLHHSDFLGRWGGEEFLVIAPQTDSIQARGLAERLRQAITVHSYQDVDKITASFGVAEYRRGESAEVWLKRVDVALYAAKQGGRNQVAMELNYAPKGINIL